MINNDVKSLLDLQEQINTEMLAQKRTIPCLWAIVDYRFIPANEEYDEGDVYFVHKENDTIFHTFDDLKLFIEERLEDEVHKDIRLLNLIQSNDLVELWNHYFEHYNNCDLDEIFLKKDDFIVPDSLFLTKKEAMEELERKKGKSNGYTEDAYITSLTTSSPQFKLLLNFIQTYDFSQLL